MGSYHIDASRRYAAEIEKVLGGFYSSFVARELFVIAAGVSLVRSILHRGDQADLHLEALSCGIMSWRVFEHDNEALQLS